MSDMTSDNIPSGAPIPSGPEAQVNQSLAELHQLTRQGLVVSDDPIVPGIWLSLDPESATQGSYTTAPGMLLSVSFHTETPGRWQALHLGLGGIDLRDRHVLGFVLRSDAPQTVTFRACLRSGEEGGFTDHFFPRHIVSFEETSVHVDLLQIGRSPDLAREAPWRHLILFFKPQSLDVTLRDMRVFVL